ncbi:T9SS type A sorting domain-containing protein [Pseudotamlana agarivorans]|uniref:T9SS type A sorting domain-containing protein n=1 Tax=Pseudotamlana agarivorans TaxID=481183 RepID=UPI00082F6263|nr:T9SS type A sorting domain-containing protein [Tamlana agarivorans]
MKTKLHQNRTNHHRLHFTYLFILFSLFAFSQTPVATTNTLISGVSVASVWHEEITGGKTNYAINVLDGDPATNWAGQSAAMMADRGEPFIFDLGGTYDLAELQYLTVTRTPPYEFQIWVSTNTESTGDFVNVYPGQGNHFSATDNTYKSFTFTPIAGAKYVMLKCYGRSDSFWNTISELLFYSASTASVEDNELSGFALYPNPAKYSFTLSNLSDKVAKVQVVDLLGKSVLTKTIDSFSKELSINTSNLVNGIYLVRLSGASGGLSASRKMVVQH